MSSSKHSIFSILSPNLQSSCWIIQKKAKGKSCDQHRQYYKEFSILPAKWAVSETIEYKNVQRFVMYILKWQDVSAISKFTRLCEGRV
jgi:hypothetical protein